MTTKIDHEAQDQIINILGNGNRLRFKEYADWWTENFSRVFEWDVETTGRKDMATTRAVRFYKEALGKQDCCVTFSHRNWVWTNPKAGWTLYCDRRGPALHVRRGMSPSEAWEAFTDFRGRIDAHFAARAV
ncbi:hypothetical protein N9917_01555 [Deltaproteobacteria bacterium]|nr:hypothetical protein [Deltaproteobacteria bacterium]